MTTALRALAELALDREFAARLLNSENMGGLLERYLRDRGVAEAEATLTACSYLVAVAHTAGLAARVLKVSHI